MIFGIFNMKRVGGNGFFSGTIRAAGRQKLALRVEVQDQLVALACHEQAELVLSVGDEVFWGCYCRQRAPEIC